MSAIRKAITVLINTLMFLEATTYLALAGSHEAFTGRMEAYLGPQASSASFAEVENLRIQRDRGVFFLEEGMLYLCEAVDGKVSGAMFHGKGRFTLSPYNDVERQLIFNEFEQDTVEEKIEYLYLSATDSLIDELRAALAFSEKKISKYIKREQKVYEEFITNSRGGQFYVPLVSCIENEIDGFFIAIFGDNPINPQVFMINPLVKESVTLRKREMSDGEYGFKIITQYHPTETSAGSLRQFKRDTCVIVGEIYSDISYGGSAEIRFMPQFHNWSCLPIYLYENLEIDSVYTPSGLRLPVYSPSDRPARLVELDRTLAPEQLDTIIVSYRGDIVYTSGWIAVRSHFTWYPRLISNGKAPFDLTFTSPKKIGVISEGSKLFERVEGKSKTSRWVSRVPIYNATFNVGEFFEVKGSATGGPEIRFFAQEAAWGDADRDAVERMLADITQASAYFSHVLGAAPFDTLTVTEYGNMVAQPTSPGLIHLPYVHFYLGKKAGETLIWRLQAAARQWFSDGVDYGDYHDFWISHGITEYVSLLMLQQVRSDQRFFYDVLKAGRKDIMHGYFDRIDNKKYAEPLTAGYRSSVYGRSDKAVYIMHMLRVMLDNPESAEPERFYQLLRALYQKCLAGELITTDLLQELVDETFGMEMGWFFDQWVHGSHLPEYKYAVATNKNDAGKFVASVRIDDALAPDDFRAIVPLLLIFKDDRFAQLKILVTGKQTEVNLPAFAEKPEKIIFNDMGGVLCAAEEVKW